MRILITGVTGFVGGHLVERLLSQGGHELHGLARAEEWPSGLSHLGPSVQLHRADLHHIPAAESVLEEVQPEWIFHLAGYANTGGSFRDPTAAWAGNLIATLNLYEAITRWGGKPRVLYTSTGLVYGNPGQGEQCCTETDPLLPASPYASSKAAADLLSYQVTRHPGIDVVRVRCFNQIGPRQTADYATANFARQIALIEAGRQPPLLRTGDLSGQRDLTDVRDMVRAFISLLESGATGEVYNAGSGIAQSMRSVLGKLLSRGRVPIEVHETTDPNRRQDTAVSRADVRKLQSATGWRAEKNLDDSLSDLLDYWRQVC